MMMMQHLVWNWTGVTKHSKTWTLSGPQRVTQAFYHPLHIFLLSINCGSVLSLKTKRLEMLCVSNTSMLVPVVRQDWCVHACGHRRDSSMVKEEIKAFLGNRRISQAVVAQVTGERTHSRFSTVTLSTLMLSLKGTGHPENSEGCWVWAVEMCTWNTK